MKVEVVLFLMVVAACNVNAQIVREDGLFVFGHNTSNDFEQTVRLSNLFDTEGEPKIVATHESVRVRHSDLEGREFHIVYGPEYAIRSIHMQMGSEYVSEKNVRKAQQQIVGFVSNLQGANCYASITPDGRYEFLADMVTVDQGRSAMISGYLQDGRAQLQVKLYDSAEQAQKMWDASLASLQAREIDLPGDVKKSTYLGKAQMSGALQFLDGKAATRRRIEARENRPVEETALEIQNELMSP